MTAPATPEPAPQTIALILERLSRFGVLDGVMELGPLTAVFNGVGRTSWLERSASEGVGRTRWPERSTFDDVGRTINSLSGGIEVLAVVINVNVLSGNCAVGLIRCVEVASN